MFLRAFTLYYIFTAQLLTLSLIFCNPLCQKMRHAYTELGEFDRCSSGFSDLRERAVVGLYPSPPFLKGYLARLFSVSFLLAIQGMFGPSRKKFLGTMTSADFLQFVVTTEFFSVCKTSSGKRNHFHLIYLLHLHLEIRAVSDFVLFRKLVPFKMPYMQFLFIRPRFCPQRHF